MADKKSWLEHVRAGEPFEMLDWDFVGDVEAGKKKAAAYNAEPDFLKRQAMLSGVFGKVGKNCVVLTPVAVDVGYLTELGDDTFINANCTLLDTYPIVIGSRVQIGPNCGFYPVGHPLEASRRSFRGTDGGKRSITRGAPIVIEDDVWIGGHVVVVPGVTIGARSVIGAGSVVTKSVPPDAFAAGNPVRVIRAIDNSSFDPAAFA
jgi:maltose O-acetyltransferase